MPDSFFLTLVTVVEGHAPDLRERVARLTEVAARCATDFEIVVVDNASQDASAEILRSLAESEGSPNLQVYVLTDRVDVDTALFVGVERAIGDYVATVDLDLDDPAMIESMVRAAHEGHDVVFVTNERAPEVSLVYRAASAVYHRLYRAIHGLDLRGRAPRFRLMSRQVVNYVLQFDSPSLLMRHLPLAAGYRKAHLGYRSAFAPVVRRSLRESVDASTHALFATGSAPMRLATALCMFGALANIVYSVYVVAIFLFKEDVAQGWVTLSLQQSGMFFLVSLVLLILSEYVLQVTRSSAKRPMYSVGREHTSPVVTRKQRLNVEDQA